MGRMLRQVLVFTLLIVFASEVQMHSDAGVDVCEYSTDVVCNSVAVGPEYADNGGVGWEVVSGAGFETRVSTPTEWAQRTQDVVLTVTLGSFSTSNNFDSVAGSGFGGKKMWDSSVVWWSAMPMRVIFGGRETFERMESGGEWSYMYRVVLICCYVLFLTELVWVIAVFKMGKAMLDIFFRVFGPGGGVWLMGAEQDIRRYVVDLGVADGRAGTEWADIR